MRTTRFDVSVTITDLSNGEVIMAEDVPDHLAQNWATETVAQWAGERESLATGKSVEIDYTVDPDVFGTAGLSFTEYFRAGARFRIAVTVVWYGIQYVVKHDNGNVWEFDGELAADRWAEGMGNSVVEAQEVVA